MKLLIHSPKCYKYVNQNIWNWEEFIKTTPFPGQSTKKKEGESEAFILFALVWFYDISNIVGYLMPNPISYIYKNSISNNLVSHKYAV